MKQCVSDWKMENDNRLHHDLLPASNQKSLIGQDDDLIELLWENGHVVLHNQTNCRSSVTVDESKKAQKPETLLKWGVSVENSSHLVQEDETGSWLESQLEDPVLYNEFSEFFCNELNADTFLNDKLNKGERCMKFSSIKDSSKLSSIHPQHYMVFPPKSDASVPSKHPLDSENNDVLSFSHQRKPISVDMGEEIRSFSGIATCGETAVKIGESFSMKTMESSICGSNQDQIQVEGVHISSNDREMENSQAASIQNCSQANAFDPMVASTSGGSGCRFGRVGHERRTRHDHKRKGRDVEESECNNEDVEKESIEANKLAHRTAPSRRSRASEVHNLSERRRRDRINEKMRALQELIPHCNKSDKASMLDEAIEYLKSLQLQVQLMWMGSGMVPMMFPSVQQCMSSMGIGMDHLPLPSMPSSVQLPAATHISDSISLISTQNQPRASSSPVLNPLDFPNQLSNFRLPVPFSNYLGFFPNMQLPTQVMGMYAYGSQVMHPIHSSTPIPGNPMPTEGAPSENIQKGQTG